jgi:hypothetical protein
VNQWDAPTMAVAPKTLEASLREIEYRFKQAKKDLDKEAKDKYAKDLKQKRKVDRLVRTYGEFEDQVDRQCAEIQEAAAAEYAAIREPVMMQRAEDHAEAVAAGMARRRALEMSVEEQLEELSKTVNRALNHKVWDQARDNRKVASEIEGEMVATMQINMGPHDPHGAEEGGRNYFEAVAGVEGRVRLDIKRQEQRDREAAERASESAAIKAAHAAARRGRTEMKRRQLAKAGKVAAWAVDELVREASRIGQSNLDDAQAQRDAEAKKFMEDFERQQAEEEAAANTPAAIAAREAQLLAASAQGIKKPAKYQSDKGVSFLQRRLANKGKMRAQVARAAREKAEAEAAKAKAEEDEVRMTQATYTRHSLRLAFFPFSDLNAHSGWWPRGSSVGTDLVLLSCGACDQIVARKAAEEKAAADALAAKKAAEQQAAAAALKAKADAAAAKEEAMRRRLGLA